MKQKIALFSDIDNSLLVKGMKRELTELVAFLQKNSIALVPITGREIASIREQIHQAILPFVPIVISSVGTMIHLKNEMNYSPLEGYRRTLIKKGFDKNQIGLAVDQAINQFGLLRTVALETQNCLAEEIFKLSYYFYSLDDSPEIIALKVERIFQEKFPLWKIACCEEIHYSGPGKKYCLDILAADKLTAVKYIAEYLNIHRALIAGDSGNDASMIIDSPINFTGCVVGGAKPELLQKAMEFFKNKTHWPNFYQAENGKKCYIEDKKSSSIGPESILKAVKTITGGD